MKITVIGCGRWGTFIAWYLDKIGHSVSLYGRKSSAHMQKLIETRTNGLVELPETLHLTNSLDAVKELGLEKGKDAYAIVKATSVMVGVEH